MPMGIAVRFDNPFPVLGEFEGYDDIAQVVDGKWEGMPYPTQLNRPNLLVFVNDIGLLTGLPYNRWGIVGNFCIVKMSRDGRFLTISDAVADSVFYDLRDSSGYLDPACKFETPLREPFAKYGVPPLGWKPPAGKWFK